MPERHSNFDSRDASHLQLAAVVTRLKHAKSTCHHTAMAASSGDQVSTKQRISFNNAGCVVTSYPSAGGRVKKDLTRAELN